MRPRKALEDRMSSRAFFCETVGGKGANVGIFSLFRALGLSRSFLFEGLIPKPHLLQCQHRRLLAVSKTLRIEWKPPWPEMVGEVFCFGSVKV